MGTKASIDGEASAGQRRASAQMRECVRTCLNEEKKDRPLGPTSFFDKLQAIAQLAEC